MAAAVVQRRPSHEGVALFDARTPVHFGIGVAAGLLNIEPSMAVLGALGYQAFKDVRIEGSERLVARRSGESYVNQISDVILTMLGVYTGEVLRKVYRQPAAPAVAGWSCM